MCVSECVSIVKCMCGLGGGGGSSRCSKQGKFPQTIKRELFIVVVVVVVGGVNSKTQVWIGCYSNFRMT